MFIMSFIVYNSIVCMRVVRNSFYKKQILLISAYSRRNIEIFVKNPNVKRLKGASPNYAFINHKYF